MNDETRLEKVVKDQEQEELEMDVRIIGVSRDHRELICSNGFRIVSGSGEFDIETMNQQLEEAGLPPLKEINPEPLIHGEYLDNMAAQYGITRDGRSDADLADAILKKKEEIERDSQHQNQKDLRGADPEGREDLRDQEE